MKFKRMISMLLAFGLITGCSSSSTSDETETVKEDTQEETKEEPKEEAKEEETKSDEPAAVGTSITTDGVTYTLEAVDYSEGSNQYAMPEEGNNFVHCTVKIENGTDEDIDYNSFYGWKMLSPTGAYESQSIEASTGIDNTLSSGSLAPGGYIEGVLSYEEPIEGKLVLVAYTDVFSDEIAAQWLVRE